MLVLVGAIMTLSAGGGRGRGRGSTQSLQRRSGRRGGGGGSFKLIFQIIGWGSNLEFDFSSGILMKGGVGERQRERDSAKG